MACIGVSPANGDSEMEEGEIVDEIDDLSDISSEEEFLLRQRLEVLENYNNVLERKQAKKSSNASIIGKRQRNNKNIYEFSEVAETDLGDNNIHVSQRFVKKVEPIKPHKKKKLSKESHTVIKKIKDCKKKTKLNKKKNASKMHIKSSDDSEDEYFNKRRRLADAVTLRKNKNDTSTLKDRINRMLFGIKTKSQSNVIQLKQCNTLSSNQGNNSHYVQSTQNNSNCMNDIKLQVILENKDLQQIDSNEDSQTELISLKSEQIDDYNIKSNNTEIELDDSKKPSITNLKASIDLCNDNESSQDVIDCGKNERFTDSKNIINDHELDESSDEDLELLRQYALKTKSSKSMTAKSDVKINNGNVTKPSVVSEDEDSDTAELRMICLKSTLLKKAIEMKQKQKLRKRLSHSSCLQDEFPLEEEIVNAPSENNTDIESVDMDIGSDGEEKSKENSNALKFDSNIKDDLCKNKIEEDELEEDEDLLRAKLLTSLSKNLPNLVDLSMFTKSDEKIYHNKEDKIPNVAVHVPEEKKIIITLGESDSEGENEATKNLTKMHMKLAEHYQDFQSKLDQLLKSTRKEFEKDSLSDVVQKHITQKSAEKFVPKAMNHLPKSEQIEYKNLVKRMAELEKIKQARNSLSIAQNNAQIIKETLKPRNASLNTLKSTNMEEKIALSRKKIAEESAKILKLKDEAKKLQQKYKIVATELKNISTAITFNKKQQRAVHNNLQQIRLHHQLLLKGSTHNLNARNSINKYPLSNKQQKENDPMAEETPANMSKFVKLSFINDVNKDISATQSRLSVPLDMANNKKTMKVPKSPPKERVVDIVPDMGMRIVSQNIEHVPNTLHPQVEKGGGDETLIVKDNLLVEHSNKTITDDYKSPLEALGNTTWKEDPNAFLCPYEVGGSCRDPECKYLHPKIQSHQ